MRATTGVDGGATAFCDYDPFGAAYDLGYVCPEDVAFAGQGRDAGTGWYRLRARQYDPKVGRFVSPDPAGYAGGENLYAYANNNPLRWVDLTGLDPTDPATGRPAEEEQETGGLLRGKGTPADRLVPYGTKGQKASGILDTGDEQIDLESGKKGPAASMPANTPGMTKRLVIRDHVEAHAAAVMRQQGLRRATLYINKAPCPGPLGCDAMLPHMLPEGARLTMHIKEAGWTTRYYIGLPDSAYTGP